MSLTLNMASGDNNETIWVFRLHGVNGITYFSTRDITLNNTYDGKVLNGSNPISNVVWSSTIAQSGGAGSVTSYTISISRYVDNADFNGFFDEFYPATSGLQLTSRAIDIGVCWVGADVDTKITWLLRGRAIEYSYSQRTLDITVFEADELSVFELPYYSVQKNIDNDISYFPDVDDEIIGTTIPIIYGGFNTEGLYTGDYYLTPAILVDKKYQTFIIASHYCDVTSNSAGKGDLIYRYLEGVKSYLIMSCAGSALTNSIVKNSISLQYTPGSRTWGRIHIRLTQISPLDTADHNIPKIIDSDTTTYEELDADGAGATKVGLYPVGSISSSNVGWLGSTASDISVRFLLASNDANARSLSLDLRNESNAVAFDAGSTQTVTGTSPAEKSRDFGTLTAIKKDAALPWTIEEICGLTYIVNNEETSVGNKIRIYNGVVYLTGIYITPPRASVPYYGDRTR